MKKLLLCLLLCSLATAGHAQFSGGIGTPGISGGRAAATPAAPSLVISGGTSDNGTGANPFTLSVNIGTATATRVILIGTTRQNGAVSGVTVNSIAASAICTGATGGQDQFWALVGVTAGSGTQTVAITGGVFEARSAQVWVMDGLGSTTVRQTNNNSTGINVTNTDYLFSAVYQTSGLSANWSNSTYIANDTFDRPVVNSLFGDWSIVANNASFFAVPNRTTFDQCTVTYR